jgi:RNA polymerase sigma factor (sigma-70 family)
MDGQEQEWREIIEGLRAGDEVVVRTFYEQYGRILHRIAGRRLASGLRRRVDASDIVQSVFRTFFRRAHEGQFSLPDNQKLWNLLCAITLTKVRQTARFHLRQKRGLNREVHSDARDNSGEVRPFEAVDPGLSPASAVEFTDQFQQLLESLDPEEQQVVDLKLQDCTNEEAAATMGVSERTVRRIISRLRDRLERAFGTE